MYPTAPHATGLAADPRTRLVQLYYLATPGFVLADVLWSANFRAVFLADSPTVRYAYYGLCLTLGIVTWRWPRLTATIAYLESSANICLLVIGVWVAYVGVIAGAAAEAPLGNPFTPSVVTNLVLSACMLTIVHAARIGELRARRAPLRGR